MKVIELEFKGYRRDANKSSLEEKAGIYCVYRCTYDGKYVSIKELLYIGEAQNIRTRLATHNKYSDWLSHLKPGEILCYSRAFIANEDDRLRAEAALIFYHTPPENSDHVDHFGYRDTKMILTGKTECLETEFIVLED